MDLRGFQVAFFFAMTFAVLLFVALALFPPMRGPTWKESDTWLALVFALLAIAWRPDNG